MRERRRRRPRLREHGRGPCCWRDCGR
jgi:hypothetical protein